MNRSMLRVVWCLGLAVCASGAWGQATRTWVSGVGDDANPCSRTAPCKTFAGAISKTAAGGEINVLDPGGFGAVTITKAITISAEGVEAGVLVSGTNAIVVNAGPNDAVILRGLDIQGLGTGLDGVRFLAGGSLTVERSTISRFAQKGIAFLPSGASSLAVRDTVVRDCRGATSGAILIAPSAGGSARVSLENVSIDNSLYGVRVQDFSTVAIRGGAFNGSANNGIFVVSGSGAAAQVNLEGTQIVNSTVGAGVRVQGAGAVARLAGSHVSGNGIGLIATAGGEIVSYGDNRIAGNLNDGAPTSTIGGQ